MLVRDITGLSAAAVQAYALLLEDTGAPGLVVLGDEGVNAVVAAVAVAELLGRIASVTVRGVPDVMGPAFVCTKHQPPLYLYPRTGDQVPRCPGDPLHGRMERADTVMFSTILKAVTGYFDRQSTLTTFFPLLLFWGVVIVVVFSHYVGWAGTLARWNGVSGTAQALLMVAFLSWVALWTFFMLNFRGLGLVPALRGRAAGLGPPRASAGLAQAVLGTGDGRAVEGRDAALAEREALLREEAQSGDAFPRTCCPRGRCPQRSMRPT